MTHRKLRALYIPPSIIEQLVQMPGGLDMVKELDIVVYAGGPLGQLCGDTIASHVQLSAICKCGLIDRSVSKLTAHRWLD